MQINYWLGRGVGFKNYKGRQGNIEGGMCVFIFMVVVMVSQIYTYIKADQIAYFRNVKFIIYHFV